MSNVDLDVSEGWVRMYHPDLPNDKREHPTSVVTLESFEDNHSEKGWVLVGDNDKLKTNIETNVTTVVGASKTSKPASGSSSTGGGS